MEIEESALTGESIPTVKSIDPIHGESPNLGDLSNMAFMGTLVTRGNGIGIVTGTGMKTAMGKIADMIQTTSTMMTPLQRRLEQLGKILITVALLLTSLVVVDRDCPWTRHIYNVSCWCIFAVAAIPEGLPAIVTVALITWVYSG